MEVQCTVRGGPIRDAFWYGIFVLQDLMVHRSLRSFSFLTFLKNVSMAALGLHCCSWTFSRCREHGLHCSCRAQASHCGGFSCCGTQALEHMGFSSCCTQTQWLWLMGLVVPQHVGSSWTRDQTGVPCIARETLNHWTTREFPSLMYFKIFSTQNIFISLSSS